METSTINSYLTSQFWDSSDKLILSSPPLGLEKCILPKGSVLFQTSGSSGEKKWVVHTRESLLESAKLVTDHLRVTSKDRWLLALPIHHVAGFGVLARSYLTGCCVVPLFSKWNALDAATVIDSKKVTLCSFVPTQMVDLVNAGIECPKSVRAVVVGGGKLDSDTRSKALNLKWPILESYGMTETGSQIATQLSSEDDGLAVIKGWSVRVDKDELLEVKGNGLMKGYLISQQGQFNFLKVIDEDGWFKTSDKVTLSKVSRQLKFVSRNDRTVKILGELVNLDTLEDDLVKKTKVDIYVVEVFHERRGFSLNPVIERSSIEKLDSDLLASSGLHRLEPITICEAFPRNEMGKLDRVRLRELVVLSD